MVPPVVILVTLHQLILHQLLHRLQHHLVTQHGIQLGLTGTWSQLHSVGCVCAGGGNFQSVRAYPISCTTNTAHWMERLSNLSWHSGTPAVHPCCLVPLPQLHIFHCAVNAVNIGTSQFCPGSLHPQLPAISTWLKHKSYQSLTHSAGGLPSHA